MGKSAATVQRRRVILASAASGNHYGELLALIRSWRCHVKPKLTELDTFVLYDLGLTSQQREEVGNDDVTRERGGRE
jgi:hypothetical protein